MPVTVLAPLVVVALFMLLWAGVTALHATTQRDPEGLDMTTWGDGVLLFILLILALSCVVGSAIHHELEGYILMPGQKAPAERLIAMCALVCIALSSLSILGFGLRRRVVEEGAHTWEIPRLECIQALSASVISLVSLGWISGMCLGFC